jgi:hypothetical protein
MVLQASSSGDACNTASWISQCNRMFGLSLTGDNGLFFPDQIIHAMADDATDGCATYRSKRTPACQYCACHTTYCSSYSSVLLPRRHSGAATQGQGCGEQKRRKLVVMHVFSLKNIPQIGSYLTVTSQQVMGHLANPMLASYLLINETPVNRS